MINNVSHDGLVGIGITSYNYGHYIEDAVKSVINQTSPHWKLVIYDNGSTDNTFEVLKPYLEDPRVSLFVHETNIGARNNSVFAVRSADTEFFAILQADDFLESTFVEKALYQFHCHPETPFVFFNWHQYMDDTKKSLFHNRFPFPITRSGQIFISPYLTVCNFVPLHMAVFKTKRLQKVFEMLLNAPLSQVGEQYILKLLEDEYGYGCYSGTLGGVWRRHAQQMTAVQMSSGIATIEEPLERHWYATTAPSPNYINVFLALVSFIRFSSQVGFFTAADWLLNTEGVRYAEYMKIPIKTERFRLQGVALVVALKFTTFSALTLCNASDLKSWLEAMHCPATRSHVRALLSLIRLREGDVFLNAEEIQAVCNRFFPLEERELAYAKWHKKHQVTEVNAQLLAERTLQWRVKPNFLILTVFESTHTHLLADTIDSLNRQFYQQWSLGILSSMPCPVSGIAELDMVHWIQVDVDPYTAINQVLNEVDVFDWVTVLESGVMLAPEALSVCVDYINLKPEWSFIYSDEDTRIVGVESLPNDDLEFLDPLFKPDFNFDLLRSTAYVGTGCWIRKSVLDELGGYCGLAGVLHWDAAFQVLDRLGRMAIGHIPEILVHKPMLTLSVIEQDYLNAAGKVVLERHLQRNGITAAISEGLVKNSFYIQYPLDSQPMVTIVMTVFDERQLGRLKDCLNAIIDNTAYHNYQILVTSALEASKLEQIIGTVTGQSVAIHFTVDEHCTSATAISPVWLSIETELLLLFSPDLLVVQNAWLENLVAHALRNQVGMVSARIVDAEKKIYHAGVILGMGDFGIADFPNRNLPMDVPGYMARTQVVQNFSAVSHFCCLVKKELLQNVLTEDAPTANVFSHYDCCLRIRQQGLLIVWTPFATVVLPQQRMIERSQDELRSDADFMLTSWLPELANDPSYNRHLSLKHRHFKLETETDVTWNVDFHDRLRVYAFPANDSGVGEYRVRAPLRALTKAAMIQSSLLPNHNETLIPDIVEIARVKPDVILLQNAFADYLINAWQQYRKFNDVFLIYAQDDLVYALPHKHPLHNKWPKDVKKRIFKILSQSDRLIVATEPLKEAFGQKIADVRLVPNYLETARWTNLEFIKLSSPKPRVGWAGGGQHQGDLEFILPVIEATKEEVDWVFFGMCPDSIRPHIHEYHGGVTFDWYPQKLASLNLDLAVAPLEHNNFNMAKTNLRLLEYGILGWPVLCTDIFPYQNAPVTRVPNMPHIWIKKIREMVHDLPALKKEGLLLQEWVRANYLLEGHLDEWLSALTP